MTMPVEDPETPESTADAIRAHHARLGRTVADHALTIRHAVDKLTPPAAARDELIGYFTREVLPHAIAEENTLYRAGAGLPAAALLVNAMTEEHVRLRGLAETLRLARTPGEIGAAAAALDAVFQAHIAKENDDLLPALVEARVDLAALLAGTDEITGAAPGHHHCTCGGHDDPGGPTAVAEISDGELDVRALAPAQRHEQIFAAFEALAPGTAFVLVNDHDPKPLRYQFAAEHAGRFTWEAVESGPEVWRVRIGRP
ncbi:DUF2249 domain-containing protein [Actinocorallia sp. B10E7]|uniref:DUF2249 domain-containing protein n=1 Tax=Actinocorallia sp. B10E7 TaxID=3153558 RepID=UPI00325DDC1A